jgi:hypothetical protein
MLDTRKPTRLFKTRNPISKWLTDKAKKRVALLLQSAPQAG